MERADGRTIIVGDQEVTALGRRRLSVHRRGVGFVFQRFHLLPALTVMVAGSLARWPLLCRHDDRVITVLSDGTTGYGGTCDPLSPHRV